MSVRKAARLFNPFSFAVTGRPDSACGLRIAAIMGILHPMPNHHAAHMCRCCPMRSRTTGRAGDGMRARARVGS